MIVGEGNKLGETYNSLWHETREFGPGEECRNKKKGEEIEDLINGRFINSTPDVITSFMSRYRKQAKEKISDLDKLEKLKPLARRETQGF